MTTSPAQGQPDRARQMANLRQVWQLVQSGQLPRAQEAAGALTRQAPGFAEAWHALSFTQLQLGQPQAALQAITRANELIRPPRPPWQLQELVCLDSCGQRGQAIELACRLVQADSDHAPFHANLSQLLFGLQQFEMAELANQRALSLQPGQAALHLAQASIELALGRIEQARAACQRCLQLAPDHADALYFRTQLFRQTEDDNHIDELKQRLSRPPADPVACAKLHYALAKELEDLGDFEASFPVLRAGAQLYRRSLRADIDGEIRFLDAIRQHWDADQVRTTASASAEVGDLTPLFVVGLPRTGTTLIERILSAHSQVRSAGELPDFSRLVTAMVEDGPGRQAMDRSDLVAASTRLDFSTLGQRYLAQARPLAMSAPCLIDKFPQNALYLGLIRRALPGARLVLVRRHPMDACYSMYKQIFTDIYHFSYDLEELARYYIAHHKLMQHWQAVLGDQLLVIRYEDMVDDQEQQSRRLLAHCGLAWESGCLDFHRNPAPSTTASASQVRRRIYRSSLGKWKQFRNQLEVLEDRLASAGCLDDWSD